MKNNIILATLLISFCILFYIGVDMHNKEVIALNKIEKQEEKVVKKKKKDVLKNMKYIYQNTEKYGKYKCEQGPYLNGTYKVHGCIMFNFVMVNNAMNEQQTSIDDLYKRGYTCHFDFENAKEEFGYTSYEFYDFKKNYIKDMNHKFDNKNNIIPNKKEKFSFKDALDNDIPVMIWMVPNKDQKLDKGHLITVYKYKIENGKTEYYFYDTFNKKEPSRKLSSFMERWKIAHLHIYNI